MDLNEQIKRIATLAEAQFNYHVGDLQHQLGGKGKSENIIQMDGGRGTGHFGTGTYFSTYKHENKSYDEKYGEWSDYQMKSRAKEPIHQLGEKLYRVDFDFYKNLYRCTSEKHATGLFKTLRTINGIFNSMRYDGDQLDIPSLKRSYLILVVNMENLGLKMPTFREFIRILEKSKEIYKAISNGNRDEQLSDTVATQIMKYNGFNGVNVQGIPSYDNTTHGSVVYDLDKQATEPVPLQHNDFFGKDHDYKTGLYSGHGDFKSDVLKGKHFFDNDIKRLTDKQLLFLIKYSPKLMWDETYDKLPENLKKVYANTIESKLRKNEEKRVPDHVFNILVSRGRFDLINDPEITFGYSTLLSVLLDLVYKFSYRMDENLIMKFLANIKPQTEDQQEDFNYIKQNIQSKEVA